MQMKELIWNRVKNPYYDCKDVGFYVGTCHSAALNKVMAWNQNKRAWFASKRDQLDHHDISCVQMMKQRPSDETATK